MARPSTSTNFAWGRRKVGAFTLAESLVASVVLALAVLGVSGAIIASDKQSGAQQDDAVAVTLARQLMEEVAVRPIVLADGTGGNSGWPAVTDRSTYDTTADFNGYRDVITVNYERERRATGSEDFTAVGATPPTSVIAPAAALPTLTYGKFLRTVTITTPTFSNLDAAGDLVVATVQVTSSAGRQVTLSRLITKTTLVR
jgi:hypothetical protein